MEEWKEYKLGDILTIKYGKDHKKLADGYIPVYGSGGIMRYADKYLYEGPSILIPRKGSLNNILFTDKPFWTVDTMFWTIINDDIVNPLFLYYSIYKKDFSSLNVGTAVPSLTVPVIENIDVLLPSKSTQNRIVSILKSLDDKIENNRKINENLEAQAQALFKSWFVDFEPFRDQPFVDSELGPIPQGWKVVTLDSILQISKKTINPSKYPKLLFSHYSIPSFDNNKQPESQLGKEILSNKFIVQNKMVLFSKLNPRIKRIWYVNNIDNNAICSTEFIPYIANDSAFSVYIFSIISSQNFYDFVLSRVNGATGSHQRFQPKDTSSYLIPFNHEVASNFCVVVNPLISQTLKNHQESLYLAKLRDTLLPKLMSGEIKV